MPSFAVRNFGCRVNQAEAFAWAEAFRERGLRLEEDWSRSDVILVNSCTLTGRADRDVRKFIQKAARENPGTRIVVTGCYAERAPADIARLPNVVAVLPNSAKHGLPERMLELFGREGEGAGEAAARLGFPPTEPGRPGDEAGAEASFRSRAILKIQDGCDNRCAFCVIPSVRGRSASVGQDEVITSVRRLAGRGFREIVLAGIHLSSYGEDLESPGSLLGLLREIETVPGVVRIRLSSLDPRKTDGALLEHIAANPKICQHFHLSLQHASERILRLMGRAAAPGMYKRTLEELRSRSPEAALGADVIVGFPGETEDEFSDLRMFLESSPLTYFHVFSYSPRLGTPAAARPRVPDRVVKDRSTALRRLAAEKNLRFRRRFLGRELEAAVIRKSERGAEVLTGNYIRAFVPACRAPEREIVRVAIGRVLPRRTEGEVVE
jgi:threonylcarbamoyladenosine tRNA methylthiotransferase MtaB